RWRREGRSSRRFRFRRRGEVRRLGEAQGHEPRRSDAGLHQAGRAAQPRVARFLVRLADAAEELPVDARLVAGRLAWRAVAAPGADSDARMRRFTASDSASTRCESCFTSFWV